MDRQKKNSKTQAVPPNNRSFRTMFDELRIFAHDQEDWRDDDERPAHPAAGPGADADAALVAFAERWREPRLTQQRTADGGLRILAEVPGATRDDVFVALTKDTIQIEATGTDGAYRTEIPFAEGFDPRSARLECEEGYVELRLQPKRE